MPNLPTSQATPGGRRVPLFGHGHCPIMLADADAGFSQRRDQAIKRWREDVTCDDRGSFTVLRGMDSGVLWSPAWQPFAACEARR